MNEAELPQITCVRLDAPYQSWPNAGWLLGRPEVALLVDTHIESRESAGSRPLERTTVACAWSPTHLHVVFHCDDRDIWGTHERRDDPLYDEEVVEVFLSPSGDVRHYFELELSPRNVVFDATVHSPELHRRTMVVETAWDCEGLETVVETPGPVNAVAPDGRPESPGWWVAEFHIPFAGLGVEPPRPGDIWRGNFYRIDRPAPPAHPEFSAWSPTGETPANFHVPARFGRLVFGGI
jgi:hypothetical protein